ncbi:hypothetical protein [Pseudoxanthomonas suwonensis]|uniref:hypothetical protein n=1 Tax=Pseudoxanthomonas suwonensis TaxID=314722 RepID=UPI00138EDA09|nr:hypothetical protein [Pseudoxanthomonas suwonensis]KAF1705678.1 hypothetical protein CSC68_00375 [Pseudoxanthomonas suwonensis]
MHQRHFHFDGSRLRDLFQPRKPRHPLLRVALGLVGVAVLALLVFVSVFVGAAMLAVGLGWKLLRSRGARPAATGEVMDAEYRVLRRQALPR